MLSVGLIQGQEEDLQTVKKKKKKKEEGESELHDGSWIPHILGGVKAPAVLKPMSTDFFLNKAELDIC